MHQITVITMHQITMVLNPALSAALVLCQHSPKVLISSTQLLGNLILPSMCLKPMGVCFGDVMLLMCEHHWLGQGVTF